MKLTLLRQFAASAALAVTALAQQGNLVALNGLGTRLYSFDAGAPGTLLNSVDVQGLALGDFLVGIDFRPSTGGLYGVARSSRVYLIDPHTGAATAIGAGSFATPLAGRTFGVDFNPVPDRIRIVSNAEQNLRAHPDTGAIAGVDTPLAYVAGDLSFGADPALISVAYSQNFAGTTSTTLYGLDSRQNTLVMVGGSNGVPSPNGGQLTTVGALNLNISALAGFDISSYGGAFVALNVAGAGTRIYSLNLATAASTLLGTVAGGVRVRDIAVRPASSPRAFAIAGGNRLVSFVLGRPDSLVSDAGVSGLALGESIVALDFRPATGSLYGLGDTSRLYEINVNTAIATPLGAGLFTPALGGQNFGLDFNPTVDRIRLISDAEQNLRLHPVTGAVVAIDGALAYASGDAGFGIDPAVVGSAYTRSFAGSTSTTLYGIDAARDVLVSQGSLGSAPVSPNSGQLFTVGALGVDASAIAGFDISVYGGAFATSTAPGASSSQLYVVNLASGAATLVGTIATGPVRALAIAQPDIELAYALTADNQLASFHLGAPSSVLATVPISGLVAGETVLGIDFRPATAGMIALGSSNRLYRVNRSTGVATAIGMNALVTPLSGVEFGVDFNPAVDRLRVTSDAEQNLRLDPNTGAVAATDGVLAYAAGDAGFGLDPRSVAAAYDRNFAGTTQTTLYALDSDRDVLLTQGSLNGSPTSPNSGALFTVGALGFDATDLAGFDISALGGAYAALQAAGASGSTLVIVNLTTGAVTQVGAIGAGLAVRDLALLPAGL